MQNMRSITLYTRVPAGIMQSAFCFEKTALNYVRDEKISEYVIAINGRILSWEGVSNPHEFIKG